LQAKVNTKTAEILGKRVELAERRAGDVLAQVAYYNSITKENGDPASLELVFYFRALIVAASLWYWLQSLNVFSRMYYRRKFRARQLVKKLTPKELERLAELVILAEGGDPTRKEEKGGDKPESEKKNK
jgi:hypothetical protein